MVERESQLPQLSSDLCTHAQTEEGKEGGKEGEKGKGREIISAVLQNKPSSGGNTEVLCLFIYLKCQYEHHESNS